MEKKFNLLKEILIGFVLGAVICAILSAVVNYFLVKMPATETVNAVNHAVSGFISGGISAVAGTLITAKKLLKR
jgi:Trk-type K+ transport system membrane component